MEESSPLHDLILDAKCFCILLGPWQGESACIPSQPWWAAGVRVKPRFFKQWLSGKSLSKPRFSQLGSEGERLPARVAGKTCGHAWHCVSCLSTAALAVTHVPVSLLFLHPASFVT